jgi:FkbH-like protein
MSALDEIFAELDEKPSLSQYGAAERKLRNASGDLAAFRLAILANHTFDIGTVLAVECARRGLRLISYSAGYDQYRQELLDPNAGLGRFQPDAVFISLHLENTEFAASPSTCGFTQDPPAIGAWVEKLGALLLAYRKMSPTPVLLQNFVPPASDMDGLLSAAGRSSVFDLVMELNLALRQTESSIPEVYVIDAARLAARNNLAEWSDRRLWFLAKVGISPKKFPLLASEVARYCAALRRPAAKCVVVDLDNTIWGGILGDAGPEGIQCTDESYPGNAYAAFQRALLALRSRGILLAVASKNDAALVDEVFRKRTDMVLRKEHITDWEVHWEPKPDSLKRIAARLNIGLDSLVFLDDNPAEVALVKMALPSVRARQMPSRPEDFVKFLGKLADFDQLRLSAEDMRRPELYELRKKQTEMSQSGTDLETFYRSLKTVLAPQRASGSNFDRVVQLIQKTNQFNLTTRRHDKPELMKHIEQGSELWAFRARDVHGDHGIIAVALLDFSADSCRIDSFVMSCRVIGRTLETAILHFLEERARARKSARMIGEYLPTAKNEPCRDFYQRHNYACTEKNDQGTQWSKRLEPSMTESPEWIEIEQEVTTVCDPA